MCAKELRELTYEDDKLGRNKEFGEGVLSLIQNSEKITDSGSLVLALDSGWGTGKTWFLNMFMNDLKSKDFKTIYYNAWENDDWNNALIPVVARIKDILSESPDQNSEDIIEQIEDKTNEIGVFLKNNWKTITFNITSGLIKKATTVDLQKIKEIYDKVTEEQNLTKEYDGFIDAKKDFIKELAKLSEDQKVIFLIDELDRCKPTFAIETLEVIKHFFDVKNFIFVFALDMEQLSHSIKTTYGQDMDAPGYLRRFFDMQLRIPSPLIKIYIENLIEDDLFHRNFRNTAKLNPLRNIASDIFDMFYLSLRDIDIILTNYKIFHKFHGIDNYPTNISSYFSIFLFLITIKYKNPEYYNTIFYKSLSEIQSLKRYYFDGNSEIQEFISAVYNGKMQKTLDEIINENHNKNIFKKIWLKQRNDNETLSNYLERHLEILGFPEQSE